LDALEALLAHREAVVVVGAQAVYLHTGGAQVALAEATKDSDLALDTRHLGTEPHVEDALRQAGFELNKEARQPGMWVSPNGVPVDLMVPEALGGRPGHRAARIPPHGDRTARQAVGLEAAVVDNLWLHIPSLVEGDTRVVEARVAGPAALIVAKLHKIHERRGTPDRLVDKDAHDVYRLLVVVQTHDLVEGFCRLRAHELSRGPTEAALQMLHELFSAGPDALGSEMAGRAEEGIGQPATVAAAASALADDLLRALNV
jgi:hypothetical protein